MADLTKLWDQQRFLSNPDKGWFHHYYDDGDTRYKIKSDEDITNLHGLGHLYLRMAWSTIEPNEGQFDWAAIDDLVDKWCTKRAKRYKFGITIPASETAIPYATPEWVKQAGAQGAFYDIAWAPKEKIGEPAFDDPVFLQKLENFYKGTTE